MFCLDRFNELISIKYGALIIFLPKFMILYKFNKIFLIFISNFCKSVEMAMKNCEDEEEAERLKKLLYRMVMNIHVFHLSKLWLFMGHDQAWFIYPMLKPT